MDVFSMYPGHKAPWMSAFLTLLDLDEGRARVTAMDGGEFQRAVGMVPHTLDPSLKAPPRFHQILMLKK